MTKYKILRILFLIIGLGLLITGIITGDFVYIFRKAVKICYECVGIG